MACVLESATAGVRIERAPHPGADGALNGALSSWVRPCGEDVRRREQEEADADEAVTVKKAAFWPGRSRAAADVLAEAGGARPADASR